MHGWMMNGPVFSASPKKITNIQLFKKRNSIACCVEWPEVNDLTYLSQPFFQTSNFFPEFFRFVALTCASRLKRSGKEKRDGNDLISNSNKTMPDTRHKMLLTSV